MQKRLGWNLIYFDWWTNHFYSQVIQACFIIAESSVTVLFSVCYVTRDRLLVAKQKTINFQLLFCFDPAFPMWLAAADLYLSSFCLQNKKNLISPTLLDENFSLLVSLKISLNSCSHKFAYDPIKISMFPQTWTVLPVSGVMPSMVRMISKVCSPMSRALILQ